MHDFDERAFVVGRVNFETVLEVDFGVGLSAPVLLGFAHLCLYSKFKISVAIIYNVRI